MTPPPPPPLAGANAVPIERHARTVLLLLMLGTVALCTLNAGHMVFMDPDEGRYVLIAKQMLTSGDWLMPRAPLVDTPYFDKPILYFWLLAGSFRLFGVNEFAARLVSAVGAALLVGGTYQLGRVLLSSRAALWAALLLGTSALTTIAGRYVRMDLWLTAFITWGVYGWARFHFQNAPCRVLYFGYACLAAACLTKGLLGALLALAAVGAFLLVRRVRDWHALRRANLLPGLALIVVLAGPWFVYMSWRCPGYALDFFFRHHVLRATTDTYGRSANPLYLPAMAVAGFLPWSVFVIAALVRRFTHRRDTPWLAARPGLDVCYWWVLIAVIPFMLFRTKLPVYVMPAFPVLALITGDYVATLFGEQTGRQTRWVFGLTLGLMGLSLVALAVMNQYSFDRAAWLTFARRAPVFVILLLVVVRLLRASRVRAALQAALALTILLVMDTTWVEGPGVARYLSSQGFATAIADHQGEVDRVLLGPAPQYAVFCYLESPLPVKYLAHVRDFLEYSDTDRPLLALLTNENLVKMARVQFGDRLTVIAAGREAWLLKLRPAASSGS